MAGHSPALAPSIHDPAEARALLDQSSYRGAGNLPPVLSFTGDPAMDWAWREYLGVKVISVTLPEPQDAINRLRAGELPVWSSGWCADYPDPQNFLEVLFHSESEWNHTGYADPLTDALLEAAATGRGETARVWMYREAERRVLADYVAVPFLHSRQYLLVKPYVKGYRPSPIGIPWLADAWIER